MVQALVLGVVCWRVVCAVDVDGKQFVQVVDGVGGVVIGCAAGAVGFG